MVCIGLFIVHHNALDPIKEVLPLTQLLLSLIRSMIALNYSNRLCGISAKAIKAEKERDLNLRPVIVSTGAGISITCIRNLTNKSTFGKTNQENNYESSGVNTAECC